MQQIRNFYPGILTQNGPTKIYAAGSMRIYSCKLYDYNQVFIWTDPKDPYHISSLSLNVNEGNVIQLHAVVCLGISTNNETVKQHTEEEMCTYFCKYNC